MRNLLNNTSRDVVLVSDAGTAASTAKGTIVDMQGFGTATFDIVFGNVLDTAEVTVQVAQGDVNNTANMVVSEAKLPKLTATATSLDNKMVSIEVVNPAHRYLEIQVVVATANAPIASIVCTKSNPSIVPAEQGDNVLDSATFVSPGAAA